MGALWTRRAWNWLAIMVVAALAGAMLVGCTGGASDGGGNQITVKLDEFKFEPKEIKARAGQAVKITLQNVGKVTHDFTVTGLDEPVSVTVDGGKSETVEFTPKQPGTYEIVCVQPGHTEAGMKGTLVVQ